MSVVDERREMIQEVAGEIMAIIGETPSVDRLEAAKGELEKLSKRADLFPADEFPLPGSETTGARTFLIYDNDQGAGLYAVTSIPGKSYRPHDHGGSWVVIAAVTGQEQHTFYTTDPDKPGHLINKGVVVCEPGTPVSMMPDGIHAIEGVGEAPLFHLHFYGTRLQEQAERTEYDLASGTTEGLKLTSFGHILDKR